MAASHEGAMGDEVEGGETDDEVRRAHERVDDEDGRVETSEDETTTTRPHAPQSMLLEGEWTGQASGGISKPTAPEMDPTRPSRDPAGTTGDDERRPDGPTEPPDKPQGAGGRDGDARVETEMSRAFGARKWLSTVPNTMGQVPGATGASAASKRTRSVDIPGH